MQHQVTFTTRSTLAIPPILLAVLTRGKRTLKSRAEQQLRLAQVAGPTPAELNQLIEQISQRIARHLERRGLLVRDDENSYLEWDGETSPMDDVIGHSVTYRIAVGPHQGQKRSPYRPCERHRPVRMQTPAWPALVDSRGPISVASAQPPLHTQPKPRVVVHQKTRPRRGSIFKSRYATASCVIAPAPPGYRSLTTERQEWAPVGRNRP